MPEAAPHWAESALCAQTDWTLWFPEKGDSAAPRLARAICARCPVRDDCRDEVRPNESGIWAGTSKRERQQPGRKRGKDTKPRARAQRG